MMTPLIRAALLITSLISLVSAATTVPAPNAPVTTTVNGVPYTWQETVAYNFLSSEAVDQLGDTIGGIGSAISVKKFKKNADGTYSGTFLAQPDRGHNTVTLENYAARYHSIDFVMKPCTASDCTSANSLQLTYVNSLRYDDTSADNMNGGFTSGLDAVDIRVANGNFPVLPEASNGALAVDAEGIAFMKDGSHWTSDEYGPTIYHIAADGTIISAIEPPEAILPHLADGSLYFETEGQTNPYGRSANQGFEGLTVTPDNTCLYALIQSALMQDQDAAAIYTQYTRMLGWDITDPADPILVEQYVVQLPTSADGQTVWAASELYYVSEGVFMILARDGKGDGNGSTTKKLTSVFKNIGLVTTVGASNINGLYDGITDSVAPLGVLRPSITPVVFNEFINIIDPVQLARFGLHNGPTPLATDIGGKFESIAIQPALDPLNPQDFFVFTVEDNDFISTVEYMNGVQQAPDPYGECSDNPTQFFVYRVTLPGADIASYLLDQSLNPSGLARRARPKRNICGAHHEQCFLGGSRFECIDTDSNLEQCGACAAAGGVDCSNLPGVVSVACIEGVCVADECDYGFSLIDNACY